MIMFLETQYWEMRERVFELIKRNKEITDIAQEYASVARNLRSRTKTLTSEERTILQAFDRIKERIKQNIHHIVSPDGPKETNEPNQDQGVNLAETENIGLESHAEIETDSDENSMIESMSRAVSAASLTPPQLHHDILNLKKQGMSPKSSVNTISRLGLNTSLSRKGYPSQSSMAIDSRLIIFLKFPLFASFPKAVLETVLQSCYEINKSAGEVIVRKGETGGEIFFLIAGTASVVENGELVSNISTGSYFGELGIVVSELIRTASIVAKTDCQIIVVTKQKLSDIVLTNQRAKELYDGFVEKKLFHWKEQQTTTENISCGSEFVNEIAREEINKLGIFSGASDSFINSLSLAMKFISFNSGTNIVTIGEESDAMYFILKGAVEVVGQAGAVNAEILSGSFFGEVGVLLNLRRTASIRAKEDTNVLRLFKTDLDKVVEQFPSMKSTLKAAADERYELFKQRTAVSSTISDHIPDQFDMEVATNSLAKLSIFEGIDDTVLSELSMKMTRRIWKAGEIIIRCHEPGTSMYFLAAGNADIISEFNEIIDSVSGPSAYFGEVSLIEQVPRTATVKCTSVCSTYELTKSSFNDIIEKYPRISAHIKEIAAERMQSYLVRSVLA
ncbi:cyclic nucleotide-binding-like protein [Obelidium mucronatum]|nr:cyclic nucleotide-binding-like protein [Obelidium mucronatum]